MSYIYQPSKEKLDDVWLQKLVSEDSATEYGGELYFLSQGGNTGSTLLELSECGNKYRYVWKSRNHYHFDTGNGTCPSPRWLNPEGLVHRDKQPLPFSWRS